MPEYVRCGIGMVVEPLPVIRVGGEGAKLVRELGVLMVYSRWVKTPRQLQGGELVVVEDEEGDILGCGFYDPIGPVAVRLVELGDCSFSSPEEAIRERLEQAFRLRRFIGMASPGRGYRLVHSDGDLLPGLIVDVYDDLAVYQSSSMVWDVHANVLVKALIEILDVAAVYEKSTQRTRRDIGLEPREGLRYGSKVRVVIEEASARFIVDPRLGQKTGFFLDQALNRMDAESLVEPGVKVLDLFSYTGGFGIHALLAGAKRAIFVEEDEKALKLLRENLRLNHVEDNASVVAENVWHAIRRLGREGFEVVFVDPPAFIPDQKAKRKGMEAYTHIYSHALRVLKTPGLLFYSSCSTFLSRQEFTQIIAKVMATWRANYIPLGSVRGAPPDHPVRPGSPHLEYLKAMYMLVSDKGRTS